LTESILLVSARVLNLDWEDISGTKPAENISAFANEVEVADYEKSAAAFEQWLKLHFLSVGVKV
jgi:hypothetical protein